MIQSGIFKKHGFIIFTDIVKKFFDYKFIINQL